MRFIVLKKKLDEVLVLLLVGRFIGEMGVGILSNLSDVDQLPEQARGVRGGVALQELWRENQRRLKNFVVWNKIIACSACGAWIQLRLPDGLEMPTNDKQWWDPNH